ncbi:hypothetical protein [Azospirillum rugosum]|uniref:Transglycosylase SLT domain-containing protein n=1 Tax=Azospirillum rugosum TaxID=416170 RepID=A0ABS4SDQ5_9PROT|nr:hypothetical protein [Azospirillum rugosum]MBP2290716.1 hypothetical protein [Azospirillum rugosum]MDQ0525605.1 hypothetical protein [Azospirillum rugosum]
MTMDLWGTVANVGNQITDMATKFGLQEQKRQLVTFLGNAEVEARTKLLELQDKHRENPDAFRNEWDGYRKGVIKGAPAPYAQQIDLMLQEEGNRGFGVVLNAKHSRDERLARQSTTALLKQSGDDVINLAMAGRVGTPEYQEARTKHQTKLAAAVSSGLLAEDEAAIALEDLDGRAAGEHAMALITPTYAERGADATRSWIRRELLNPELRLRPAQRIALENRADSHIAQLERGRKADLHDARAAARELATGLTAGLDIPPETVDEVATRLTAAGGARDAAALRATHVRAGLLADLRGLPLDQLVDRAGKITASMGLSLADRIVGAESGGRADAKNPNSSAAGLGQFIDSTWLETVRKHAPEIAAGKTDAQLLGLRSDQALSRRMVTAHAEDNRAGLAADGLPTDDGAVYLAHFLGRGGAATVLKAPDDRPMEMLVSADVIKANPFLKDMTAGDIRDWAAEKVSAAPALDPKLFSGVAKLAGERAHAQWSEVEAGLNQGIQPTRAAVETILKGATLAKDYPLLERIATRLDRASTVEKLSGATPQQQQAAVDVLDQRERAQGLSTEDGGMLIALRKLVDSTRDGLKRDPLGLAVERGVIPALPPIPWNDPAGAAQALSARQRSAVVTREHYGVGTQSVIRPDELPAFKAAWDQGDAKARAGLVGTLARALDGDHLTATLEKVGADNPVFASAGLIYRQNPELGTSIISGQTYIDADKKILPPEKNIRQEANDFLGSAVYTMPKSRDGIVRAATARYADLSVAAKDFSGAYDSGRMQQALRDVSGGVVSWGNPGGFLGDMGIARSPKIIPPKPYMTDSEFEKLIGALTDEDFSGAITAGGYPLKARDFRRFARLEDAGPGQYTVWLSSGSVKKVGSPDRPYVLDLGKKVAQ